jgi:arylsulfatase A-like enzyme
MKEIEMKKIEIKKTFIVVLVFGITSLTYSAPDERPEKPPVVRPSKPNIVLLLADDLGWQDVKCYDIDEPSPMETPNIDALAKKGVQFWQAYSPAPTCAPARAAILSGDHPARAQMTHVSGGKPPHAHSDGWAIMSPWYSVRMPAETVTIAEALKANGYTTGHSGKWHIAMHHHGYPQPEHQGFDYTRNSRGVQGGMPNRLTGFATRDPKDPEDPYRLDENGFPFDQTTEDAMTFVRQNQGKPFFLYFASWLVHTPISVRSEALLRKYERKLGVEITAEHQKGWTKEGQSNPFYCAMVEELDYYAGRLFDYLESTEDPRWPGHKLIENTYVIFSSDNGGMEGIPGEIITDNYPLDKGKISAMEGGTRVPLIIVGPDIPQGVQSDVMVNGLDFYPTILALSGTKKPDDKHFDGCDLSSLLKTDPTNAALIRNADGLVRDTMAWHFPNSGAQESTIRIGDYKLVRNYSAKPELELYRLYDSTGGVQDRVDIEEAKNLATSMPEKTAAMNARLTEILTEMKASYPYNNPNCPRQPDGVKAPTVLSHTRAKNAVVFTYRENGAKVIRANLIYTLNGGDYFEEWFRQPATLLPGGKVSAQLPQDTTHYLINLIDENNFLVSYPEIVVKDKQKYSTIALPAESTL